MRQGSVSSFGQLLRQLRKRAGMNQEDLATAVNYSISYISSLERGTRLPQIEIISQKFIPVLELREEQRLAAKLIELAAEARGVQMAAEIEIPLNRQEIASDAAAVKSSLPIPPTNIIGREGEIKAICNRLVQHRGRLLTLLGPPGVGKTRLALEIAGQLAYLNRDGVRFLALATIQSSAQLASSMIVDLGLSNVGNKTPEMKLVEFLHRREILLVLDNFEHLIADKEEKHSAISLVATLLRECPSLQIIVTSRERLHLRAEQRYKVEPLAVDAAVALFVQRMKNVEPDFICTADAEITIRQICLQLDCLPLAIELAAARVDLFSLTALLAHLQKQRLDVLVDGAIDLLPHQRTLRSAIQSSYVLLGKDEKHLFMGLSVFVGGFYLDVVELFGHTPILLESLMSKNLVYSRVQGNERRFAILDTLREFALEQLTQSDQETSVRQKQIAYLNNLIQPKTKQKSGKIQLFDRLEQEHENIRAALYWGVSHAPQAALNLAVALKEFWSMRGYDNEAVAWLRKTVAVNKQPSIQCANALLALSSSERRLGNYASAANSLKQAKWLAAMQNNSELWLKFYHQAGWYYYDLNDDKQTLHNFEKGLALARSVQNEANIVLFLAGLAHQQRDLPEQRQQVSAYLEECLALLHSQSDPHVQAFVLQQYGALEVAQQRYASAVHYYAQMLALYREIGDKLGLAWGLELLAEAAWFQRKLDTAQKYHDEAFLIFTELDNADGIMIVLHHLGQVARRQGRLTAAISFYTQSLADARTLDNRKMKARCLAGLGGVALLQSDYEQAGRYMFAAKREFDALPPFLAPIDAQEFQMQFDEVCMHMDTMERVIFWKEQNISVSRNFLSH